MDQFDEVRVVEIHLDGVAGAAACDTIIGFVPEGVYHSVDAAVRVGSVVLLAIEGLAWWLAAVVTW